MAAAVLLAGSCLMMLSAPALHRRAWAPPPHAALLRAPQPLAAVADSRYRKSRGLYERLEEGRDSNEAPPAAPITRPVLLAPAGGWPQVEAAIKGGADAIYFGCAAGLNARARATNFGEEELPALMAPHGCVTVVISPLISLMVNQTFGLNRRGHGEEAEAQFGSDLPKR